MRHFTLVTLFVACYAMTTELPGNPREQSEYKSKAATEAIRKRDRAVEELDQYFRNALDRMSKTYLEQRKNIQAQLLASLEAARRDATLKDDLDEAVKLKEACDELQSTEIAPPAGPTTAETNKQIRDLKQELAELKRHNAALQRGQAAESEKATQALQAFLVGTRWQWDNSELVFTFGNGIAWMSDKKTRWQAISPNTVLTRGDDGTTGVLTFNEQRTHFLSVKPNGYRAAALIGKQ